MSGFCVFGSSAENSPLESSQRIGQAGLVVEYPSVNSPKPRAHEIQLHRDHSTRIVINIPERILRVYRSPEVGTGVKPLDDFTPIAEEYRVAVGMKRYPTPILSASITGRRDHPTWFAPREPWAGKLAGAAIPFDSPENPFRARNATGSIEGYFIAIGTGGVGLHSTGEPGSVGRLASHGCIRMRLDDVRHLYRSIPDGTPVEITYELFRLERAPSGIRIKAFDDVYGRLSTADKIDALCRKFAPYDISIANVSSEQLANLIRNRSIEIPLLSQPQNLEHNVQLKKQQPLPITQEASNKGRDIPAILAKSVAENLMVVNFP